MRALELRRFRPVGEVQEVGSDFRLVAATNRDLENMSRTGQFRGDLLYRLQGITTVTRPCASGGTRFRPWPGRR